jgi:hypothetical protein
MYCEVCKKCICTDCGLMAFCEVCRKMKCLDFGPMVPCDVAGGRFRCVACVPVGVGLTRTSPPSGAGEKAMDVDHA